ncbi:hypothetical protein TRP8649_00896 [Pelagimonas phthalicica]|uniref:Glycosyl transferase family 2 n=1 Tax=Pelagimonas phthalicica TaxID=1037362 RepID=A0A238J9A6_9RHOB|nr:MULTISPECIES: hypothetical protein [Roseobacteraceae]MBO9468080.1 hypothetical protein [Tropicibacter sp. R15_0]TDS94668.1 hypothetical protein CLV87_1175 [Pelagimonas phthalicica]SMX26804.1 hypothetical protein TRP8649_00896 [Pelagimonas phthalicica]
MSQATETTGVLIIHNDSSLLAETLQSAKHLVDSLVVVDGAYDWVAPFCEMNGEDPEKSTDNLLEILDQSGLPYTYHTGTWQNETHKRQASLEFVKTDRVMLIDSDEIYNIDDDKLQTFWASGKVMASLQAPLFLHQDVVTWHSASNAYPLKPVFLNLAGQEIETVVASLWLLLPDSEKGEIVDRALIERVPLGIFYHLSMFRTDNNPYRRSRFYNLLSMRVGKRIGLDINKEFSSDAEFTELVRQSNRVAMNNMFNLHRLAAAFPQKKNNQDLVIFDFDIPAHGEIVAKAYQDMLADQRARTEALRGTPFEMFIGRGAFLDMTGPAADGVSRLDVELGEERSKAKILWHVDFGTHRTEIPSEDGTLPPAEAREGCKRLLVEITLFHPTQNTASMTLNWT